MLPPVVDAKEQPLHSFYAQKPVKIENHQLIQKFIHLLPCLHSKPMIYLYLMSFIRFAAFFACGAECCQQLRTRLFTHRVIHSLYETHSRKMPVRQESCRSYIFCTSQRFTICRFQGPIRRSEPGPPDTRPVTALQAPRDTFREITY